MRIIGLTLLCGAMLAAVPASAQAVGENNQENYQTPPTLAYPAQRAVPVATLSADETTWHLRAALNVAALSCRDADERETAASYNAMLEQERVPLARANAAIEAQYRARYGRDWQAHDDGDMTRLYNFFAAPAAQGEFCATAKAVLHDATTVEPSTFGAFAAEALPALERSFGAPVEMASRDADGPPARVAIATNAPAALAPGY
ncbi:MAG: hypothetical protein ABIS14_11110 [Sphingomonas sp.]